MEFKNAIYVAMLEEARFLAKNLGFVAAKKNIWPYSEFFVNQIHDAILITGGRDEFNQVSRIGKIAAAQMTALFIARFSPKQVWNIGIAGGIADFGANVGDVYTGPVQQHDVRVPHVGFKKYAERTLQTRWQNSFPQKNLPENFKTGLISSGESFTKSENEWQRLKETQACVVDMEAFAVAEVVEQMLPKDKSGALPLFLFKGVTDVVSLETCDETQAFRDSQHNFKPTLKNICDVLQNFLVLF